MAKIKILYPDKSNANPITDANKQVTAQDMNEIKKVVNEQILDDINEILVQYDVNTLLEALLSISGNGPKRKNIEGRWFTYFPIIGNSGATSQPGDIIMNGWRSQNEFWEMAVYVSGDDTKFPAWKRINYKI